VHTIATNYANSCSYILNGVLLFACEVPKNNRNATTSMLATTTAAAPTTGLYLMGVFCTLLLVSAHYRCSILPELSEKQQKKLCGVYGSKTIKHDYSVLEVAVTNSSVLRTFYLICT